jgi:hypothetical protein
MKATREQHIRNEIHKVNANLQDAMLTAAIQDRKVLKLDFTGSDLRLRMEGGRSWIFSAVSNDEGKPVIEFAFTPAGKLPPEDYSI